MAEIPSEGLTKISRDAIEIARCLGFPWLWIDSLCDYDDSGRRAGVHEAQIWIQNESLRAEIIWDYDEDHNHPCVVFLIAVFKETDEDFLFQLLKGLLLRDARRGHTNMNTLQSSLYLRMIIVSSCSLLLKMYLVRFRASRAVGTKHSNGS
jgi:hypothetical protein